MPYIFLKIGDIDKANNTTAIANMPEPQEVCVNELDINIYQFQGFKISKICQSQDLEMYFIFYLVNQPTNLRLWGDSIHSISIYGLNKHLEVDAKQHCNFSP